MITAKPQYMDYSNNTQYAYYTSNVNNQQLTCSPTVSNTNVMQSNVMPSRDILAWKCLQHVQCFTKPSCGITCASPSFTFIIMLIKHKFDTPTCRYNTALSSIFIDCFLLVEMSRPNFRTFVVCMCVKTGHRTECFKHKPPDFFFTFMPTL